MDYKISRGTKNFAKEDAIPKDHVERAILAGIDLAKKAKEDGCDAIGAGEIGVGNTTTSSAVLAALTYLDIDEVTGRGSGLTNDAFNKKKEILKNALKDRNPDPDDPIDVLSKVGGLEICAMCGVFLGAAAYKIPVVIDGFISVVAAICATKLCSDSVAYMFPSHESFEPGYMLAMDELELSPWIDLRMKIGEGAGCPIAFQIMKAACAAMNDMAVFGDEDDLHESYLSEIELLFHEAQ